MERGERTDPDGWERDDAIFAWIYGSVLTGAAVAVATGAGVKTVDRVFLYVCATMAAVWLAHVYAAFVGHGGRMDVSGTGRRLARAARAEVAILASAVPALATIAVCLALDMSVSAVGFAGLGATITTMVAAATYAARNTGAGFAGAALAAAGALLIGASLIAVKVALK